MQGGACGGTVARMHEMKEMRMMAATMDETNGTMSVPEAARALGLSARVVRRLFDEGRLAGFRIGGGRREVRRISAASVQALAQGAGR